MSQETKQQPDNDRFGLKEAGRNYVKDKVGEKVFGRFYNYRNLPRTFVEGVLTKVTMPLLIAEIVSVIILALLVISVVQSFIGNNTLAGVLLLILAILAFFVWRVIRKVRLFVVRRIEKALDKFDEQVSRGVAKLSDWPSWYKTRKNSINNS